MKETIIIIKKKTNPIKIKYFVSILYSLKTNVLIRTSLILIIILFCFFF